MNLKILLPFEVFASKTGVSRIVAETRDGSLGILEHRLDCAASLAPGILIYETKEGETAYVAVDEGVLVKAGADVLISVRNAVGGTDLKQLHGAVKRQFLMIDAEERNVRVAISKMESGLMGRLAEFQRAR